MTTRKIHYLAYFSTDEAFCDATPRENAPALETTREKADVTCTNCTARLTAYKTETAAQNVNPEPEPELKIVLADYAAEAMKFDNASIGARHGWNGAVIAAAIAAGALKR